MTEFLPCPHCGGQPTLSDMDYVDDNRYVQMSLTCCSTMTESIGYGWWRKLTEAERKEQLTNSLRAAWNTRYVEEPDDPTPLILGCTSGSET